MRGLGGKTRTRRRLMTAQSRQVHDLLHRDREDGEESLEMPNIIGRLRARMERVRLTAENGRVVDVEDHETDLLPVIDVYERRFRFYWLVTAWVVLLFQSSIMFLIFDGIARGRHDYYSVVMHSVVTLVVTMCIGAMAFIFRFLLFPNSRWLPAMVQTLGRGANEPLRATHEPQARGAAATVFSAKVHPTPGTP